MSENGSNCSCTGMVIWILIMCALLFGLPTPWGKINIDILPPQIKIVE